MTIHLIHLCQLSSSQTIHERTFGGFFPSLWIIAQSPILVSILASHTSLTRLLTQTFYDRQWEDVLKGRIRLWEPHIIDQHTIPWQSTCQHDIIIMSTKTCIWLYFLDILCVRWYDVRWAAAEPLLGCCVLCQTETQTPAVQWPVDRHCAAQNCAAQLAVVQSFYGK